MEAILTIMIRIQIFKALPGFGSQIAKTISTIDVVS